MEVVAFFCGGGIGFYIGLGCKPYSRPNRVSDVSLSGYFGSRSQHIPRGVAVREQPSSNIPNIPRGVAVREQLNPNIPRGVAVGENPSPNVAFAENVRVIE
jgi:hypothetical protein